VEVKRVEESRVGGSMLCRVNECVSGGCEDAGVQLPRATNGRRYCGRTDVLKGLDERAWCRERVAMVKKRAKKDEKREERRESGQGVGAGDEQVGVELGSWAKRVER